LLVDWLLIGCRLVVDWLLIDDGWLLIGDILDILVFDW
jgi:hypothetical protein